MASFWRQSLTRLHPLRRLLSTSASSAPMSALSTSSASLSSTALRNPSVPREPAPAAPAPTPTMPIPEWPLDRREEPIKTAKARRLGIAISQWKLNLVARVIRGLAVPEAHRQLAALNKKAAPIIDRVLVAAVRNARAYGFKEDRLIVHEAYVGKGVYLKRIRPWHGKGRHGVHHKKYAHLTVVVRELDDELWELDMMPQYCHFKRGNDRDDTTHPIHHSDKVSWVSDLDKSLAISNQNIRVLKSQMHTDIRTPTSV